MSEGTREAQETIVTASVLAHMDCKRVVVVEMDLSYLVSAGVLLQWRDDGILHPVAVYTKRYCLAETNYDTYDKELIAIMQALKEWQAKLESVESPILVLLHHKGLDYLMLNKNFNRR